MDHILSRPEIQSAVIPFIIGLSLSLVLKKLTASAWLWAVFCAFLVSVGLVNGLTITPLTGTRKIILLVLASFVAAELIHHLIRSTNLRRAAMCTFAILALLWVFWKVMVRMEASEMMIFIAGSMGFMLWLLWSFDRLNGNETQLHAAGFSSLLGTGLCSAVGSSALLGQLSLSMAAASGAVLLAWVLTGKSTESDVNAGLTPSFPYPLAIALLGLAAVVFARVPWYALIPLASIPLVIGFVPKISNTRFTNALITSLPGLIVALAVTFWVWQTGSSGAGY